MIVLPGTCVSINKPIIGDGERRFRTFYGDLVWSPQVNPGSPRPLLPDESLQVVRIIKDILFYQTRESLFCGKALSEALHYLGNPEVLRVLGNRRALREALTNYVPGRWDPVLPEDPNLISVLRKTLSEPDSRVLLLPGDLGYESTGARGFLRSVQVKGLVWDPTGPSLSLAVEDGPALDIIQGGVIVRESLTVVGPEPFPGPWPIDPAFGGIPARTIELLRLRQSPTNGATLSDLVLAKLWDPFIPTPFKIFRTIGHSREQPSRELATIGILGLAYSMLPPRCYWGVPKDTRIEFRGMEVEIEFDELWKTGL